jgi:hypothetical protein
MSEDVSPTDNGAIAAAQAEGPLGSLYDNKYKDIFLQFPNNIESAEESHWVRFDINEIGGVQIKQDEVRTTSFGGSKKKKKGSFLDRAVAGTAEKASALITTALLAPVNIAKSTVNEFLNDLPPVLGGVGRDLLGGFSGKSKSRGLGSIMLYAPHTRQENLKLNWAPDKLGQVGAAIQGGGGTVGGALSEAVAGDSETVNSVIANRDSLMQGVMSKLAGSALGGNADAIVKQTFKSKGQAINPHMEMFFDNVDFRAFTFDFKLAPRNSFEAKSIREIINLFKYAATPSYEDSGAGGVFFRYPNVFEITFFNENETHKIATSCLTGVNVNYTGPGINSTFYDNYPVETQLNLTFTELEIMHKGKIDKGY